MMRRWRAVTSLMSAPSSARDGSTRARRDQTPVRFRATAGHPGGRRVRIAAMGRVRADMGDWNEVGEGVFVRRYDFFDQNIVAIRGDGRVGVVDTRTTYAQARELQEDLRKLTSDALVVINTHHHFDHSNGNALFL